MSQLNKLWAIDAEVKSLQRAIETLEASMITIRASRIKEVNVQESNVPNDMVEETIMQLDKLKKKLFFQTRGLINLKEKAYKKIEKIDSGVQRTILIDRYFNRRSMEQIAEDLHWHPKTVQRYHKRAVDNYKRLS